MAGAKDAAKLRIEEVFGECPAASLRGHREEKEKELLGNSIQK